MGSDGWEKMDRVSAAVVQRWTLRRWLTDRTVVRRCRRRLEHACRRQLAQLGLSRPCEERTWIEDIEQHAGRPARVIDLTQDLRERASVVGIEHAHGHTLAVSDGCVVSEYPRADTDSCTPAVPHELAHAAWGDPLPFNEAPSMESFFRSQGEDVPDVVRFMLGGSGTSRLRRRP